MNDNFMAELENLRIENKRLRDGLEDVKLFAIKHSGHKLMQVCMPFRELVNKIKFICS